MKKKTLAIFMVLFVSTYLSAQSPADKINRGNTMMNTTDSSIDKTAEAMDNSKKTVSKLWKSIVGDGSNKKSKDAKKDSASNVIATKVSIDIIGIDHDNFKLLRDSITSIKGVTPFSKTFNSDKSNFTFYYAGKTDTWDLIPRNLQKMLIVKNEDNGSISLEMNKLNK